MRQTLSASYSIYNKQIARIGTDSEIIEYYASS